MAIPEELPDEVQADAAERGRSAYVTEALRLERERDRLLELVNWLEDEYGPVTEAERATAIKELEALDAKHERRRADTRSTREKLPEQAQER